MKNTTALLVVVFSLCVILAARADIIYGTGKGSSPSGRDANWQVVGLPTNWVEAPATPYEAYVYQKGAIGWFGGEPFGAAQTGYTNGAGQFYWIGIRSDPGSVIPFPTAWHWIVAQEFTVTQAGNYDISFPAFSDELLDVFINGSVTTDALMPTITGGTRITSGIGPPPNGVNFGSVTTVNTSAYLSAGVNTVYAQIRDTGFSTGLMLGDFTLTPAAAVPEPGTWAAAVLLVGGAGYIRWRKRKIS